MNTLRMPAESGQEPILITPRGWARLHTGVVWVLCALSAAIAFAPARTPFSLELITVVSGASALALWTAARLRILIVDVWQQVSYRERMLIFLGHLALMLVPAFFGLGGWEPAMAVLLVLLAAQAVSAAAFGRLYAGAALLALPALFVPLLPPFALTAAWMLTLLLALRTEHVRYRLADYVGVRGTGVKESAAGTLTAAVLPWVIACGGWWLAVLAFGGTMRSPVFEPGTMNPNRSDNIGPVSTTDLLIDAAILIIIIMALLILLYWIEKKLRSRKKGRSAELEDYGEAREVAYSHGAEEEEDLREEPGADPRGRVLARFRVLAARLAKAGLSRREDETALEYLRRVAGVPESEAATEAPLPRPMQTVFDRACYSALEISEEESLEFLKRADALEPRVLDEIRRRKEEEERAAETAGAEEPEQ